MGVKYIPTLRIVERFLRKAVPHGSWGQLEHDGTNLVHRFELFDDANTIPATDVAANTSTMLDLQGTGGSAAINTGGGVRLITGGTATNDTFIVATGGMAQISNADNEPECEIILSVPDLADNITGFGFKLTADLDPATDADAAYFIFDPSGDHVTTASGNWQVITDVNGATAVETDLGTNYAVVAGQNYRLAVKIGQDNIAKFYIDNKLVHTSNLAFVGDEALLIIGGVETSETGINNLDYYGVWGSIQF